MLWPGHGRYIYGLDECDCGDYHRFMGSYAQRAELMGFRLGSDKEHCIYPYWELPFDIDWPWIKLLSRFRNWIASRRLERKRIFEEASP